MVCGISGHRNGGAGRTLSFVVIEVRALVELGELQRLQFRDLRHVAANNLIEAGLGLQEVAYYLGRSSTVMLQQVYYARRKENQPAEHFGAMEKVMAVVLGSG